MKVVRATEFGGPEVLVAGEAPDPMAGPSQVVIGVSAVDVLFVETQVRSGWGVEYFRVTPPYVPGDGVAGSVISIGEGIDPGWIGRRVIARTGEQGGYAEQAVVSAELLVAVPAGLGLPEAAALLHDGNTALSLFDLAGVQRGEWVLVLAAAGGMGTLLVQLAHAAGARVIGAARGGDKLDLVTGLGAQAVVDYGEPDWADQVRGLTGDSGVRTVFDGVGGEIGRAAFEVTARGGQFSAHGAPSGGFTVIDPTVAEQREVTVRGIEQVRFFTPAQARQLAERMLADASAGRIRPVIGRTFPLERAADAHAAIEARTVIGKTLLLT